MLPRRRESLTNLQGDEQIVLFPTIGYRSPDGLSWHVQVHGDVFAQGPVSLGKRILLKLLQRTMKAPTGAFEGELFQQRIQRFLAQDRAGKKMAVKLGEAIHKLPKASRKNGHFSGILRLDEELVLPHVTALSPHHRQLSLDICSSAGDGLGLCGPVHLIETEGISVIS